MSHFRQEIESTYSEASRLRGRSRPDDESGKTVMRSGLKEFKFRALGQLEKAMQLILVDDVYELGKRGDVVRVANGYARNYLIPKKLAVLATEGNMKMVEQQKVALAKKEATLKDAAEVLANELNKLHLVVTRKAGETGVLFGSVTTKDIGDLLEKTGVQLDRRRILLHQPIKTIGNYPVEARPHAEVKAELLVSVLAEEEEVIESVRQKDAESDEIIAGIEARLKEIESSQEDETAVETESGPGEPQSVAPDQDEVPPEKE